MTDKTLIIVDLQNDYFHGLAAGGIEDAAGNGRLVLRCFREKIWRVPVFQGAI